jgi:hypothetical protein
LDQDGVPTLVEIKRQSDYRIRREVVGQMLDYAANCLTYWSLDALQAGLESTCAAAGTSSDAALNELIGLDQSIESFWQQVKANLIAGRIRLLFVADKIPLELRRVVEFLNAQMNPAEVLAIELRQYEGHGLKTIVPVVFGKTQEASTRKSSGGVVQGWDEERFLETLRQSVGEDELTLAGHFLDWAKRGGRDPIIKGGKKSGAASRDYRPERISFMPVYIATDGKLWLQFGLWKDRVPFGPLEKRRELLNRFGALEGAELSENDLTKYPAVALRKIASDPAGLSKMMSALEWMDDQIEHSQ